MSSGLVGPVMEGQGVKVGYVSQRKRLVTYVFVNRIESYYQTFSSTTSHPYAATAETPVPGSQLMATTFQVRIDHGGGNKKKKRKKGSGFPNLTLIKSSSALRGSNEF